MKSVIKPPKQVTTQKEKKNIKKSQENLTNLAIQLGEEVTADLPHLFPDAVLDAFVVLTTVTQAAILPLLEPVPASQRDHQHRALACIYSHDRRNDYLSKQLSFLHHTWFGFH